VSDAATKTTPLYEEHVRLGAKIVPFGGWLMPVQYSGIVDEHNVVRNAVGIFDISHMGQFIVSGPSAADWLNRMLTNNIAKLEVGSGQYTFLLNDEGGVIDDLIIYRVAEAEFLLVVNASKIDEDLTWLEEHLPVGQVSKLPSAEIGKLETCPTTGLDLRNRSDEFGAVAIQGPRAVELFHAVVGKEAQPPARNRITDFPFDGRTLTFARTGYTGEDGFEVFFPKEIAATVWKRVLEVGAPLGIKPCGLGARDTLRLEMCFPLNGSDLSADHNPIEAGLGFFVDLNKGDFIGRAPLAETKANGAKNRLVAFRMNGKGPPPRAHYGVLMNGERIGETTSGSLAPSLNIGIGMAYVSAPNAKPGSAIEIEIRGQKFPATIEKKPLYKKT